MTSAPAGLTDGQKRDCEAALRRLMGAVDLMRAADVVSRATSKIASLRASSQPPAVHEGIAIAERLIQFVSQNSGGLRAHERKIALAALEYLVDPWEVIPDFIPSHGHLDDAYVLDLAWAMIGPSIQQTASTESERVARTLPPNAGAHLAHRAMMHGLLSVTDRSTLNKLSEKLVKGDQASAEEYERFHEIIAMIATSSAFSAPCRTSGCTTCRTVVEIFHRKT